jgi:hypothetical protein
MEKKTNLTIGVGEALQQVLSRNTKNTEVVKPNFQIPRVDVLFIKNNEVNLFSSFEEQKEQLSLICKGKTINEFTFTSLRLALHKMVTNQTEYNFNSTYENSPVISITTTLPDLCKDAFGTPNPSDKQKEEIKNLLEILDATKFTITHAEGTTKKRYIIIMEETKVNGKPITYKLAVNHNLFNLSKGFGLLPQDFTYRLTEVTKRKTIGHLKLAEYLAIQKEKVITRYIGTLVEELGYEKDYKINKKRTEQKIIDICEDLKKTGFIKTYSIEKGVHTKLVIECVKPKEEE